MKSNLLIGASVVALGLAFTPAFADPITVDDTGNGNGILNDTQTDITGDATNSPQTGNGNFDGDVASNNGVSLDVTNDNDGNGIANDTFTDVETATNAPQTGNGNVGGNVLSDNGVSITSTNDDDGNGFANDTFQNNGNATNSPQTGEGNVGGNLDSADTLGSAVGGSNAANNGGTIDNVSADNSSIAVNDSSDVNIAAGDIAGGSIDNNDASDDALIINDSSDVNLAGGDIAENGGSIEENNVGNGSAMAQDGSLALVVDDISIEVQTDVVASNTELSAFNVLNIGSGNAIYADDSSADLTADATISGGAEDAVMVQMSANSGANAITQQSQTITANIDNLTVN